MNPKRHRPPGPSSRDLGLVNADAGKGDAPRNCLSKNFRDNYDLIGFGILRHTEGFVGRGTGRLVKIYK